MAYIGDVITLFVDTGNDIGDEVWYKAAFRQVYTCVDIKTTHQGDRRTGYAVWQARCIVPECQELFEYTTQLDFPSKRHHTFNRRCEKHKRSGVGVASLKRESYLAKFKDAKVAKYEIEMDRKYEKDEALQAAYDAVQGFIVFYVENVKAKFATREMVAYLREIGKLPGYRVYIDRVVNLQAQQRTQKVHVYEILKRCPAVREISSGIWQAPET